MGGSVQQHRFDEQITECPHIYDASAAARLAAVLGESYAALTEPAQQLVSAVGGASPYLSKLLSRDLEFAARVFRRPMSETIDLICAEADQAGADGDITATMKALRRAKDCIALACGIGEVGGVLTSLEAGAALARFADTAANAALRAALVSLAPKGFIAGDSLGPEETSGVAVIAMGKQGASELNYSSDIDLIVLFDPEAPALGDPMNARVIAVAAAKLLVKILNEQTADGYVFRTDLRLRPDPGVSAAAVSVNAAEVYYEAHGQNWERAAFIKARASAGDKRVGEAFLATLRPFIWRKYLDFAAIEDIHSIKRQIHASKGGGAIEFHGHDIKTGRGGIREIEFLVQTQQLILGGKAPYLRERATLGALAALEQAGRIRSETRIALEQNYRYLRRVEHRLQMINDEQTHRLPKDAEGATRLAVFLGEPDAAAFETKIRAVLTSTHQFFSELFEREERLSIGAGSLIFTGVENDPATLRSLEGLGFERSADISNTIRRWHTGAIRATRSTRARELLTKLAPKLLESLSKASDPDAAFVAFDEFLSRLPAGVQVFALFANNPQIFDTLVTIMTISPYLGRELSRRRNLIEAMLESNWPQPPLAREALATNLDIRLARADGYEAKLNEVRRWAAEQRFEAAAQLVIGAITAAGAATHFTNVADASINALAPIVVEETERQFGEIAGGLVVVGMGRLGAGVMTATSDIDVVFIYDAPLDAVSTGERSLDAVTYYLRMVRRFVAALSAVTEEGALYEVDMKLRPSGSKGPWAVSAAAFENYYQGDAWTWEEMALTKARIIAGDAALGDKVAGIIDNVVRRARDPQKLAADVREMRNRLAEAKPGTGPWDVKTAPGGLTDLEFTLTYLVLETAAGAGTPPRRSPEQIDWLGVNGKLADGDAKTLSTAAELFENIMQLSRAATGDVFSPDASGEALKARMAKACAQPTLAHAEGRLTDLLAMVKATYERLVVNPDRAMDVGK